MADFHVLTISFWSTSSENEIDSVSPHCIFYKKHVGEGPTLFLMNIPPYCDKICLKSLFKDCGTIKSINIVSTPRLKSESEAPIPLLKMMETVEKDFQYAYVTFNEESSVDVALDMSKSKIIRNIKVDDSLVGLNRWMKDYGELYPKESSVQSIVNEYMVEYDLNKAKEEEARKEEGQPDDEGWVTVPVKKKPNQDAQNAKKKFNKKLEKKKRSEKELMSFYLFQQREEKREKVAALRLKFEDDKKRITQLRQQRKFKPF